MRQFDRAQWFSAVVAAPFGAVGVRVEAGLLRELVYLPPGFDEKAPADRLSARAARQIGRYLADPDFRFDLPLTDAQGSQAVDYLVAEARRSK